MKFTQAITIIALFMFTTAHAQELLRGPLKVGAEDAQSCGEVYLTSEDGKFQWHIEGCEALDRLIAGGAPVCGNNLVEAGEACELNDASACGSGACNSDCTCVPEEDNVASLCPDGFINDYLIKNNDVRGIKVRLEEGEERTYCATVDTPYVPEGDLKSIHFIFNDDPDFVCAAVEITVEQAFGDRLVAGPSTGTSGSVRFMRRKFRAPDCPECVERGIYIVKVKGSRIYNPDVWNCNLFNIGWKTALQ